MNDVDVLKRYAVLGLPFQVALLVLLLVRVIMTLGFANILSFEVSLSSCVALGGALFTGVTMFRIYRQAKNFKSGQLITTDVFFLTRHPMYHGLFVTDFAHFFNQSTNLASPVFWLTWVGFVASLCIAGWCQEKETIARWGDEAKRYYARTPRFVFEWIWFWKTRPLA